MSDEGGVGRVGVGDAAVESAGWSGIDGVGVSEGCPAGVPAGFSFLFEDFAGFSPGDLRLEGVSTS